MEAPNRKIQHLPHKPQMLMSHGDNIIIPSSRWKTGGGSFVPSNLQDHSVMRISARRTECADRSPCVSIFTKSGTSCHHSPPPLGW